MPHLLTRRRIVLAGIAAALGVLVLAGGGQTTTYSQGDAAYQLAIADGAPLTDPAIDPYAWALENADAVCQQGPRQLSGMTVMAVRRAANHGVEQSHLTLLQALPGAVPSGMAQVDCAQAYELILQDHGL